MTRIRQILQHHRLRHTQSRADILGIFLDQGAALSEREIEAAMSAPCDRVTIYRTLSTFLERGIIHKVLDNAGAMRYALCSSHCQEGPQHQHDHVHFKCLQCGQTICLEEVPIPAVQLPPGFQLREVNMLLEGVCANCKT
jgi:Fur family transcriptional regulator, ferric uptake regulator